MSHFSNHELVKLRECFESARIFESGNLASYIPALLLQNPNDYALSALCFKEGYENFSLEELKKRSHAAIPPSLRDRVEAEFKGGNASGISGDEITEHPNQGSVSYTPLQLGNSDVEFSLQSISKIFSYGLALKHFGEEKVFSKVAVEPSGEVYDSIIKLDPQGRPFNPMVNAGAIAIAGLYVDTFKENAISVFSDFLDQAAGRKLKVNDVIASSERSTGHRNRSIAHLLKHFGIFESSADEVADFYFKQCAIQASTTDLANMGSVFLPGSSLLSADIKRNVLSVMLSCGMYNYAGQWIYEVGVPAKSGVSGGILMIAPGKWSIAIFSPRLDSSGHSLRGIELAKMLSKSLKLHLFS